MPAKAKGTGKREWKLPKQWQRKDPVQLIVASHERDPARSEYGAFLQDTPGYGSGGAFHWFKDREELENYFVFLNRYLYEKAPAGALLADPTIAHFFDKRLGRPLTEEDSEAFNELLSDCSLWWWGLVKDLSTSKEEFARERRADFLELDEDEPTHVRAIKSGEHKLWLEYLRGFSVG